ncbi:MAG: ABC transporter ATP-binding protein [Acidimicrobiales bacterium]|nr:MAG: ABC transporter ATP-binding protein [Acidimicrobiales bacterium]
MSRLAVEGLRVSVGREGREVLRGVDLEVSGGEVHAVMGPNGSGKSTLAQTLMGHPGYTVVGGRVELDGDDLLDKQVWERAQLGLYFVPQYPTEVVGVTMVDLLSEVTCVRGWDGPALLESARRHAESLGLGPELLERPLNVDLSGGEKKLSETVQLLTLRPRVVILDEVDSGLDVDGLQRVASLIRRASEEHSLAVVAITHYARLLKELVPDKVHVLLGGRIVATGEASLAERIDREGYDQFGTSRSMSEG